MAAIPDPIRLSATLDPMSIVSLETICPCAPWVRRGFLALSVVASKQLRSRSSLIKREKPAAWLPIINKVEFTYLKPGLGHFRLLPFMFGRTRKSLTSLVQAGLQIEN